MLALDAGFLPSDLVIWDGIFGRATSAGDVHDASGSLSLEGTSLFDYQLAHYMKVIFLTTAQSAGKPGTFRCRKAWRLPVVAARCGLGGSRV